MPGRPPSRIRLISTLLGLVLLAQGGAGAPQASPAAAQSAPGVYRLVDTWTERYPAPQAGLIAEPLDLGSSPDGRFVVLDAEPPALHVFEPDERPRSLRPLPPGLIGRRIDGAPSGAVSILGRDTESWRVDRWSEATGFEPAQRPSPSNGLAYVDIASIQAGGGYWLLAADPEHRLSPRLERYDAEGRQGPTLDLRERFLPGCETLDARAVDVDDEGRIHLAIGRDARACPDPAAPRPEPGDGRPPILDGLATLDGSSLALVDLRPMAAADDLAAGGGEIILAAGGEIYDGHTGASRHSLPSPLQAGPDPLMAAAPSLRVDLAPGGLTRAAGAACPLPGLLRFDTLAPLGLRRFGALARPPLGGPRLPIALAAGADLELLDGPIERRSRRYAPLETGPAIQTWSLAGRALRQLPLCGRSDPPPIDAQALDLARSAAGRFVVAPHRASLYRSEGPMPSWVHADGAASFIAGSAEGDRLALIDAAGRELRLLDAAGRIAQRWPLAAGPQAVLPVDLALAGSRVYLADEGRAQIEVRNVDGALQGSFGVHDNPERISAGPDGTLYVLGRGGLGLRYAPDGRLLASWPLPSLPGIVPLDIGADAEGRVYVSYARFTPPGLDRDASASPVLSAGLWVFAPLVGSPAIPDTPAGESCALRADKAASPRRLPLGSETTITLSVEGRCPGWYAPQHLAIALDVAATSADGQALERAKASLLALLGKLDVDNLWLGLATHKAGLPYDLALSHDIDALRARIATARPEARPSLAEAVGRARAILAMPPVLPDARRTLLVVVAGSESEPGLPAAIDAARDEGLDVVVLAFPTGDRAAAGVLEGLAPEPADRFVNPVPSDLDPLLERATGWQAEPQLLEWARVEDRLPANMRYLPGSAEPPAIYDAAAHSLSWSVTEVAAFPGLQLRYQLEPEAAGIWPTHLSAEADYLDRYGTQSRLGFPKPEVEVYLPPAPVPAGPIYLPFALRAACVPSRLPLDIVLVMDVSGSMEAPAGEGRGSKIEAAKAAAATLVGLLELPRDRVGVVAFDGKARSAIALSGDRAAVERALAGLETGQGTRIDLGLAEAAAQLRRSPNQSARRTVILLTDGLQTGPTEPVYAAADQIKAGGARIFTLALGAEVDTAMLSALASQPEDHLASPDAAALAGLYQDILAAIDCGG